MRTFVIGDIHGGLKALIQVLNQLEITENDQLIFMGDYVDGWSESAQTIEFLVHLSKKIKCIFIKGNHDAWCENWLANEKDVNPSWYVHGGKATIESYHNFSSDEKKTHLNFFKQMKMFHIDAQNRLFIHAGFSSIYGVEREYDQRVFYTDRSFWELCLAMDKNLNKESIFYPKRFLVYSEIYIGHTPTTNYGVSTPMNVANVWNVDTGAAFKGRITALNMNTKTFVQSETLPSLYPTEKGRN